MPPTERKFLATAGSAGGRVIPTPFEFFTTGEDNIRVISANSVLGVSLKINMRFVDNFGTITASSWDHIPNTDRTKKTTDFPLGQGAVMNLSVFASAGLTRIGQTFVIVQLIRGLGNAAIVLGTLLQGYVTSAQSIAWPGSPIIASTDGTPIARSIGGTLPGIGQQFLETVPAGARWEVLSLATVLTTTAVAITRTPFLIIDSPADIFGVAANPIGVGANASTFVIFAAGEQANAIGSASMLAAPFPAGLMLSAGARFRTVTVNMDPGDSYSSPIYVVREWLEVQ